jgi:ATP-dependent DNA ligase
VVLAVSPRAENAPQTPFGNGTTSLPVMRLPEPMLAKRGPIPTGRGWWFEPKWDGFRAIVRSGDEYCVRSRRGWLMTELLPEFASLPVEGVFDGELVAFGADGAALA